MRNSRTLLVCLIAVILIAYSAYGLSAKPNNVLFTQNTSANYANSNFSVNWTANTTLDAISNYSIYVFNAGSFVLKADNTSETGYFFNATENNGNYTFNITAVNTTGEESENLTSTWIFTDLQNATIALNSPANGLNTTNSSVTFNFTAIDNTALNCSLYIDGILNQTNTTAANNSETIFNTTLPEGRHFWNASCTDSAKNTNESIAYNIGIDSSAPEITLGAPANSAWDNDGNTNFTFTATDDVTAIDNCSLWTNTTGTWVLNLTNSSVLNSTQGNFVFTETLAIGTYKWNVECFDNLTNNGFASSNYTFTVGNATDFKATSVVLANSSNGNNPIPGSNLTINATIENAGTVNSSANITVALFLESAFIANQTISNETLTSNSSTNITFNISGGNITGFGAHSIKISVDYRNLISEENETNNNLTLILLSGLNVSTNVTARTPKPGDNVTINLTVKYQNGTAVSNLTQANFTIFDVYTYDNGTSVYGRNLTKYMIDDSQNESGIYVFNATSPIKAVLTNRAEYGNHTIRVYVKDNKSIAYYGENNLTSNNYSMQAPNLVISFSASSYTIDLINGVSQKGISILAKNNGIIDISGINLSITSSTGLTLKYNSTRYVQGISCNYTGTLAANTSAEFVNMSTCTILYNSSANGTYTLAATANGLGIDGVAYNATAISQSIDVVNTSNIVNTT